MRIKGLIVLGEFVLIKRQGLPRRIVENLWTAVERIGAMSQYFESFLQSAKLPST